MRKQGKKPIIGIMGGIGSGKTSVAEQFEIAGCKVIDADKIAHELLNQQNVKQQVINAFGKTILNPNKIIDRAKLAKIVFKNPAKLEILNNIIHPLVLAQTQALIDDYNAKNGVKAIIIDMPLLVEVGWDKNCDRLIFVDCRPELRLKRTEKTAIASESQLKIRENFQISLDKKKRLADNTIDNNSGFEALAKQVADILSDVVNK